MIYTCGDIYIDNVNGQSNIKSRRGSEGGSGERRRGDGGGSDMSIPMMNNFGPDLREHFVNP